jgi:hypothetical protein
MRSIVISEKIAPMHKTARPASHKFGARDQQLLPRHGLFDIVKLRSGGSIPLMPLRAKNFVVSIRFAERVAVYQQQLMHVTPSATSDCTRGVCVHGKWGRCQYLVIAMQGL